MVEHSWIKPHKIRDFRCTVVRIRCSNLLPTSYEVSIPKSTSRTLNRTPSVLNFPSTCQPPSSTTILYPSACSTRIDSVIPAASPRFLGHFATFVLAFAPLRKKARQASGRKCELGFVGSTSTREVATAVSRREFPVEGHSRNGGTSETLGIQKDVRMNALDVERPSRKLDGFPAKATAKPTSASKGRGGPIFPPFPAFRDRTGWTRRSE